MLSSQNSKNLGQLQEGEGGGGGGECKGDKW